MTEGGDAPVEQRRETGCQAGTDASPGIGIVERFVVRAPSFYRRVATTDDLPLLRGALRLAADDIEHWRAFALGSGPPWSA